MKNVMILTLLLISTIFLFSEECPFGLTNDPYPGKCGRYIDEDGNDICDLSEIQKEDTTVSDTSLIVSEQEVENNYEFESNGDGKGDGNGNQHGKREQSEEAENTSENNNDDSAVILEYPENGAYIDNSENNPGDKKQIKSLFGNKKSPSSNKNFKDKYFLMVLIPLFIFAILLSYFSKKKKIKIQLCSINRWVNVFLFISFLITAFTSIMLVLSEYRIIKANFLSSLIFIHNFTGIIFILASILHIYLKWQFYVTFFKCYIIKDNK